MNKELITAISTLSTADGYILSAEDNGIFNVRFANITDALTWVNGWEIHQYCSLRAPVTSLIHQVVIQVRVFPGPLLGTVNSGYTITDAIQQGICGAYTVIGYAEDRDDHYVVWRAEKNTLGGYVFSGGNYCALRTDALKSLQERAGLDYL